jgi:hypothetical protein
VSCGECTPSGKRHGGLSRSGAAIAKGSVSIVTRLLPFLTSTQTESYRMLRLHGKAHSEDFPGLHYSIHSEPTDTLHCLGKELSNPVSRAGLASHRAQRPRSQLFGEEEEDETDLDNALSAGENAAEIDSLRKQARAFKTIRQALRDPATPTEEIAKKSFQKVFNEDIKTLLSMKDMWKSRKPPTALDWDSIQEDSQDPPYKVNGLPNGTSSPASGAPTLRDQKQLSLLDCVELFGARCVPMRPERSVAYTVIQRESNRYSIAERRRQHLL